MLGVEAYNRRDYKTACAYLEQAIQSAPNDVNALYYDALSWHQLKSWSTAKARYKTILERFPDTDAAQKAKEVLRTLDPAAVRASASASAGSGGSGSSLSSLPATAHRSPSSSASDDLESLPDQASFYFTKTSHGHMMVDLSVNGHPVKALFDTGASAFFYKDQLKAAGVDVNGARAAGQTHGWAGVAVPVSRMPAVVKLGTLTRRINIAMEEHTTSLGENLIGQDLVSGYQYEIDDKGGRVNLRKAIESTTQKVDSLYDVPCVLKGKRDMVDMTINGHRIEAFLDTGSTRTIVDPKTAASLGLEPSGETMGWRGVGGDTTMGIAYTTLQLGPLRKENFAVLIGGRAGCCVGQDLMEGWRCKVDREHSLLRFFH